MSKSTTINHSVRNDLGLSYLEYCVIDLMKKYPKLSINAIKKELNETPESMESAIKSLHSKGLLAPHAEKNTLVPSELWFESVKQKQKEEIVKVDKFEREYSLHHRFKLLVMDLKNQEYSWDGVNAKHTTLLLPKLKDRFLKKNHREGTDDEILESFRNFIAYLPKEPVEGISKGCWDIPLINSRYNRLIEKLNAMSKGKIVDTIKNIQQASSAIAQLGGFKTIKDI